MQVFGCRVPGMWANGGVRHRRLMRGLSVPCWPLVTSSRVCADKTDRCTKHEALRILRHSLIMCVFSLNPRCLNPGCFARHSPHLPLLPVAGILLIH